MQQQKQKCRTGNIFSRSHVLCVLVKNCFSTFLRHPFFSYVFVFHDRRPKRKELLKPVERHFTCVFLCFSVEASSVRRRTRLKIHIAVCCWCRQRLRAEKEKALLISSTDGEKRFSVFLGGRLCVRVEPLYNKPVVVEISGRNFREEFLRHSDLFLNCCARAQEAEKNWKNSSVGALSLRGGKLFLGQWPRL